MNKYENKKFRSQHAQHNAYMEEMNKRFQWALGIMYNTAKKFELQYDFMGVRNHTAHFALTGVVYNEESNTFTVSYTRNARDYTLHSRDWGTSKTANTTETVEIPFGAFNNDPIAVAQRVRQDIRAQQKAEKDAIIANEEKTLKALAKAVETAQRKLDQAVTTAKRDLASAEKEQKTAMTEPNRKAEKLVAKQLRREAYEASQKAVA